MNAECGRRNAELTPVKCGCGGEAIVDYLIGEPSEGNSYCVYCKVCEMHTAYYDTEAEAIEAWNKVMGGNVQDFAKVARCPDPDDLISRKDAIDAMMALKHEDDEIYGCEIPEGFDGKRAVEALEKLPSAEPERKRKFLKIVVEYPEICTYPEFKGKPYYSIMYEENGETIVGFGTYKPEVLSQYLKDYFIPSAEPERKWIPVTEALPQNYEQAICIDGMKKMMIGTYGEYGWIFPCYMNEPIAWMPLPEPWRGE